MEYVHILAPLGIGVLLTVFSGLFERVIKFKLSPYLAKQNPETRQTVTHIAIGSARLSSFLANSLIFMANLLLALTLYDVDWIRYLATFLVLSCFLALTSGMIMVLVRNDIVDIAEHKMLGHFIEWWLWTGEITFNVIAIVLIGFGLWFSK